jgi:aromatic ring-opening dioxygenase catalytic subunit (LigB family)
MMPDARQPVFYITHGGGPSFWIEYPPPIGRHGFDSLREFLSGLANSLPAPPRAFLVVSAHWETPVPTVSTSPAPGMLYDYYGFPQIAYQLQHRAPGSPGLARRVRELLGAAGIASAEDADRGYDHGVFVPMMIVDPEARTPTVMLSIRQDLDPGFHLDLGHALAPLRDQGVAIIASGSSFHNLRTYFDGLPHTADAFDAWLTQAATAEQPAARNQQLLAWREAPGAREAHPREEHLIPIMVAAGAARDDRGRRVFHDRIGGKLFSCYRFG